MKVWPIDPLVPRNLRLEVPEKLPQGLNIMVPGAKIITKLAASSLAFPINYLLLLYVRGFVVR